jgi:hypothetical protein
MCENTAGVVSATFVEAMPSVFPFSTLFRQDQLRVAARYRRCASVASVNERVEATLVASAISTSMQCIRLSQDAWLGFFCMHLLYMRSFLEKQTLASSCVFFRLCSLRGGQGHLARVDWTIVRAAFLEKVSFELVSARKEVHSASISV